MLANMGRRYRATSLAYTYNEPTVFLTFMRDVARAGRRQGLRSVMVSNGYLNREPLLLVAPYLDAIKIDLKSGTEAFYRQYCEGALEPVQQTIKRVRGLGKWLEVVYLVVPGLNDSKDTIARGCDWLLRAAGPDTPLHFTRFHPEYKLKSLPATPVETLVRCHGQARLAGLRYVYVGNVPDDSYQHTYCPKCRKVVIERRGFQVARLALSGGKCKFCGQGLAGVWA
jgi:pyruvate formate lyase activating enzyme